MSAWFPYVLGAAVLYGLHQIFTKLASALSARRAAVGRVGDSRGGRRNHGRRRNHRLRGAPDAAACDRHCLSVIGLYLVR
jgi:hypothetical protein